MLLCVRIFLAIKVILKYQNDPAWFPYPSETYFGLNFFHLSTTACQKLENQVVGCHLCRQRRVKCDLTRPACFKCTQGKSQFPGYRDELDALFRVEDITTYPKRATKSRRHCQKMTITSSKGRVQNGPRQCANESPTASQHRTHQPSIKSVYPIISRPFAEPLDEYFMPILLSQFCPSKGSQRLIGVINSFPEMLENSGSNSMLALSCRALCYGYLSNVYRNDVLRDEKMTAYMKALNAVNQALQDPLACREDEVVFSVFILGLYEILRDSSATRYQPGPADWVKHTQGLNTLFRLRGPEQFSTRRGRHIFRLLNDNIEIVALMAGQECQRDTLEWMQTIQSNSAISEAGIQQCAIQTYHAAGLCLKVNQAIRGQSPEPVIPLLDKVQQNDAEMAETLTRLTFEEYMRKGLGYERSYGNTARLKLNHSIVKLTIAELGNGLLQHQAEELIQHGPTAISRLQLVADDILATVPRLLGPDPNDKMFHQQNEPSSVIPRVWADSLRLLWPLRTIANNDCLRRDQVHSAKSALMRISSEFHVQFALAPLWNPQRHIAPSIRVY